MLVPLLSRLSEAKLDTVVIEPISVPLSVFQHVKSTDQQFEIDEELLDGNKGLNRCFRK